MRDVCRLVNRKSKSHINGRLTSVAGRGDQIEERGSFRGEATSLPEGKKEAEKPFFAF